MKNSPKHEPDVQESTMTISRRNLLRGSLAGAGVSLLTPNAIAEEEIKEPATAESLESPHELSPLLDYGTAGIVLGSFVQRVIYGSAIRGIDLNWKSALQMNAAAQMRILALKSFGGEAGAHLAKEDQHEIVEGLKPVAILVGLSDSTTTALKVDEKEIFKAVEEGAITNEFRDIDRPALGAGKEIWDSYLEEINGKIKSKASQIAAITAVLAPIGTTYTSSSLANSMKKEMLRMLYEQSFAMEVCTQLRKVNITNDTEALLDPELEDRIHQKASQRSQELFNGSKGYSKLMLTLGANTQGSWGIGDPPEIYFLKNHGKNGTRVAKAHAIGAANAEIFTVLTNLWWLRKTGVPVNGMFSEFIKAELTSVKALLELLSSSKVRSVSFNDGRKFLKELESVLVKDDPESAEQLAVLLQSIPSAKLQFSLRSYLKNKVQSLESIVARLSKKEAITIDDGILKDMDSFINEYPFLDDLRKGLASPDPKKQKSTRNNLQATMEVAREKMQTMKADRLASLFEAMSTIDSNETPQESSSEESETTDEMAMDKERIRMVHTNIKQLMTNYQSNGQKGKAAKAAQILEETAGERKTREYHQNLQASARNIYGLLDSTDKGLLADALKNLTTVGVGEKDAIEGLEQIAEPGQDIASVQHETHAAHGATLLSHSAKEVLWALLTQIPAVPSAARIAAKVIPLAAGVEEGKDPSTNQLKVIIPLTMTLEAILSATADNVAAYLFGEKVLADFFKSVFGADIFEKNPVAMDEIAIAALKVAENAGNLTKVGNGPNFSQEEYTVVKDKSNAQGIAIDVSSMKMSDTLPHNNHFATAVNVMSVGMFSTRLIQMVGQLELEKKLENKE